MAPHSLVAPLLPNLLAPNNLESNKSIWIALWNPQDMWSSWSFPGTYCKWKKSPNNHLLSMKPYETLWNPVKNGIFSISMGDRRISEPSTVVGSTNHTTNPDHQSTCPKFNHSPERTEQTFPTSYCISESKKKDSACRIAWKRIFGPVTSRILQGIWNKPIGFAI